VSVHIQHDSRVRLCIPSWTYVFICRRCSDASESCFVFECSHLFSCSWSIPCAMRGEASHMPSVPAGGFQARAGYRSALIHLPILGNPLQVVCHDHVCHVIHHNGLSVAALLRVLVMKGFQHPFGRIPKRARSTLHLQQPLCEQKFFEEYVVFLSVSSIKACYSRSFWHVSFVRHSPANDRILPCEFVSWVGATDWEKACSTRTIGTVQWME
jgi:hypothetical protein